MKERGLVAAIVAFSLLVLAVVVIPETGLPARLGGVPTPVMERVMYSVRDIHLRERLDAPMIEWREIPVEFVSPDHIRFADGSRYLRREVTAHVSSECPISRTYFQVRGCP